MASERYEKKAALKDILADLSLQPSNKSLLSDEQPARD
jgi:hypothetical protein